MRAFNIGVIGLGDISNVYLNNLKKYPETVNLYGCACRSLEKASKKAEEYGFRKAFGSGDELLADPEIDVVLNLTNPETHYSYNKKALEQGKHVYCEKALAATFEQGKELIELARQKDLYVGCAPDTFMGGRLQTYRQLIDRGELGEIIGGCAFMVCKGWEWFHHNPDFYYRPGAGPLFDMGPYYITALLSLMGPAEMVCAMGNQTEKIRMIKEGPKKGKEIVVDPAVDTHITANIKFRNGAIVNLCMSFDVWDSQLPRLEIYGTKGTLCMAEMDPCSGPNLFGGEVLMRTEENSRWLFMPRQEKRVKTKWTNVKIPFGHNSVSHAENSRGVGLVDLVKAVQEKRKNRASGEMALHALEIMEGILLSIRENRFVKIVTQFERPKPMDEI